MHESTHSSVNFRSPRCVSALLPLCAHHVEVCTAQHDATTMRKTQKSHTAKLKLCAVEYALQDGNRAAGRHFDMSKKIIKRCEYKRRMYKPRLRPPPSDSSRGDGRLRSAFSSCSYAEGSSKGFRRVNNKKRRVLCTIFSRKITIFRGVQLIVQKLW